MKVIMLAVLTLLLLPGCAKFQRAETARRGQTELIGISKKDLFLCAGVPLRQERVEDLEFLSYSGGGDTVGVGVATATSSSTAAGVSSCHRRYCEVTFVLKDGKVMKVNYSGRTGGLATKGEQCAFVVENCLSAQTPSAP
jgi:hypothetical protein